MNTFTEDDLPTLDEAVLGALELFFDIELPVPTLTTFNRSLVVGSGNARATAELLFAGQDAVFADESDYEQKLAAHPDLDGAWLVSASGAKHAVLIAKDLAARGLSTKLLTTAAEAPAAAVVGEGNVYVFPKNREPYTYNTSTYMGMLLAQSREDTAAILNHLEDHVQPLIPGNLAAYRAFCFIIPPEYNAMAAMFRTKFDELFGPELVGRIFTSEQIKHAKTVVRTSDECFISFGDPAAEVIAGPGGHMAVPLPREHGPVTLLALGYYIIGHIQKQHPPFFMRDIAAYCEQASSVFGSTVQVIVE